MKLLLEPSLFSLLLLFSLVEYVEVQLPSHLTPDHSVQAQAWAGVIMLCSSCPCFFYCFFFGGNLAEQPIQRG